MKRSPVEQSIGKVRILEITARKITVAKIRTKKNSVEDMLSNFPLGRNCYSRFIADAFAQHVRIHSAAELQNIAAHGHRNDDAENEPKESIYKQLVQLAELVAAGNTEIETLEQSAKNILEEIG